MSPRQEHYANVLFAKPVTAHPVLVAQTIHKMPKHKFPQVAVVGKSNVGKSSLINALMYGKDGSRPTSSYSNQSLAQQLHLPTVAPVSSNPGRTRHLFMFDLSDHLSLVDLPGYGFARVPREKQNDWAILIEEYLNKARSLHRVISLVEGPSGFERLDEKLWEMLLDKNRQFMVVVTKVDALKPAELHSLMLRLISALEGVKAEAESRKLRSDLVWPFIHAVSSRYKDGLQELRSSLSALASDYRISRGRVTVTKGEVPERNL